MCPNINFGDVKLPSQIVFGPAPKFNGPSFGPAPVTSQITFGPAPHWNSVPFGPAVNFSYETVQFKTKVRRTFRRIDEPFEPSILQN